MVTVARARESGAALVLALGAVALVLASVLLVARLLDTRQIASSYEQRSIVLTALSDAALAETLAKLSEEPNYTGIGDRDFGSGTIRSRVTTTPRGRKDVTAIGEYGGWQSIIAAEVYLEEETGRPRVAKARRTQVAR
jgi:hypothetical protein